MYASKMDQYCGSHHLNFSTSHPTGKCLSVISSEDAERTMITDLGAAIAISDLGTFEKPLGACSIGHYEGYMLLGPETRALVIEAMKLTKTGGGLVSLDVSDPFVVSQITETIWQLLTEYVDIVFLNADEAQALTGVSPESALADIQEKSGVRTIIVKLGSQGSIIQHGETRVRIPAVLTEAIDTTGAGDAYAGGFLFGLVRGWDVEKCGHLASRVASLTVAQIGAVVREKTVLLEALHHVSTHHDGTTVA
jgi:sugar/nucleoside kinase (ribokinase family)